MTVCILAFATFTKTRTKGAACENSYFHGIDICQVISFEPAKQICPEYSSQQKGITRVSLPHKTEIYCLLALYRTVYLVFKNKILYCHFILTVLKDGSCTFSANIKQSAELEKDQIFLQDSSLHLQHCVSLFPLLYEHFSKLS